MTGPVITRALRHDSSVCSVKNRVTRFSGTSVLLQPKINPALRRSDPGGRSRLTQAEAVWDYTLSKKWYVLQ
jgi:hypothetical protein